MRCREKNRLLSEERNQVIEIDNHVIEINTHVVESIFILYSIFLVPCSFTGGHVETHYQTMLTSNVQAQLLRCMLSTRLSIILGKQCRRLRKSQQKNGITCTLFEKPLRRRRPCAPSGSTISAPTPMPMCTWSKGERSLFSSPVFHFLSKP